MKLILTILGSRTTYVILAMFIVGGLQAVTGFLPPDVATIADALLGFLAMYTHGSTKVKLQNAAS